MGVLEVYMWLKNWYVNEYQHIVYAISVTKTELDKVLSFASITLLLIATLKLFFPAIPWWFLPASLILSTVSAYWIGKWLIRLGVPKKTAQLGNENNPELQEILTILRKPNN